jgi:hypothetical protein
MVWSNKKTARVCFLGLGKPLDLRSHGFPGQENHSCDISTKKNTRAVFCLSHDTNESFSGIFCSNRRKFNSEIQYPKFDRDVANDAMMSR